MQRNIIFRGQRVDNKEWVYGDLIHLEKDFKKIVKILHWTGDDNSSEVIPETVGQFIGLLDKNGKKIFEGDLYKDEYEDLYKVIQMDCGRYALKLIDFKDYVDEFIQWSEVEIIGNIHEL